jgi:hypothetical protein
MQIVSCILVFHLLFVVIKASSFYAKDSTNIVAHKPGLEVKTQFRQRSPLENPGLFEGDIKLPPKVSGLQNNGIKIMYATAYETLLWPKGIVYFENRIEDDEFLDLLEEAMTEIESKTCVKFVSKSWFDRNFVQLIQGDGCWSNVGMIGGKQQLSLGIGCKNKKLMLHELVHSLGFYHKHSQADRDQYLNIHWNNIPKEAHDQFDKFPQYWMQTFSRDFDFMSIMLYGPRLFGIDNRMTMSRKDGGRLLDVEDKPGLSTNDVYSINSLYKCYL